MREEKDYHVLALLAAKSLEGKRYINLSDSDKALARRLTENGYLSSSTLERLKAIQ